LFEPFAAIGLLALLLVGFIVGPWRYDVVAMLGLIVGVTIGLVPADEAFLGFGHPAVITVAAVLVLSRGLSSSGATDLIARHLLKPGEGTRQVASLGGVGALLSSVMNNVGALALLLPVASTNRAQAPLLLMPLAFATILGGLMTAIGTPPNLIVASARMATGSPAFGIFDYLPVGLAVAGVGLAFVALVGWRLMPKTGATEPIADDAFDMEDYLAEARVLEGSEAEGLTISELDRLRGDLDVKVVGLIRNGRLVSVVPRLVRLQPRDILMLEATPQTLRPFVRQMGLEIVDPGAPMMPLLHSEDAGVVEAIVMPGSRIEGRSVIGARLQRQHGVNLLAVSRASTPYRGRLRAFRFQAGDILLLQGESERLRDIVNSLGCLPLAARGLTPPPQQATENRAPLALALFAGAIALGASGALPIAMALVAGAAGMVVTRIISPRVAADAIDWSVMVLLAALIPIGDALQTTGATNLIAEELLDLADGLPPSMLLALLMVVTVVLTNVLNNAVTAVVMAPLAVQLAETVGVSADPFLMGVAVSASCAFLTPIGHQNNALVMGPGGYRFDDYWRMGLPLTLVVLATGWPMVLWVWPLMPAAP